MEWFNDDVQKILIGIVGPVIGFYFSREKKIINLELRYENIQERLNDIKIITTKIDENVIDLEVDLEVVKRDVDGIADFVKTPKSVGLKQQNEGDT